MHEQIDFSKMTIEELTPIVSMRPGKVYTKEQLQCARRAFMEALASPSPEIAQSTASPSLHESPLQEEPEMQDTPSISDTVPPSDTVFQTRQFSSIGSVYVPDTKLSAPTDAKPAADETEETATFDNTFILQSESTLARVLYILYAYVTVPVITLHALVLLVGSVLTAVFVPDIPYLFVAIFSAAAYTMLVSFAWHQFMHRTKCGLLLNRALISAWLLRGAMMLSQQDSLSGGIIIVAVSLLFLVFFFGYDTSFTVQSSPSR